MPAHDFAATFNQLKQILKPFEMRLLLKKDTTAEYSLDTPCSHQWNRELFFGAVPVRKSHVSFHLMPAYMFPELLDGISDTLRKRMQGKSCFNFKQIEPEVLTELGELSRKAFARLEADQLVRG